MSRMLTGWVVAFAVVGSPAAIRATAIHDRIGPASATSAKQAAQPPTAVLGEPRVNADAKALSDFMDNVKEYVRLHRKLEDTLPKLPKEATPQQIDQSQRALARLIQQARAGAKQGDIFEKKSRAVFRRLLLAVFGGPDGRKLKDSIMDENPGPLRLDVNGRYPDTVPLSTMPPQVLAFLPKLPEEIEYRFLGNRLILFDEHAHLIPDFIENALPR
jgi:hypothetical protein